MFTYRWIEWIEKSVKTTDSYYILYGTILKIFMSEFISHKFNGKVYKCKQVYGVTRDYNKWIWFLMNVCNFLFLSSDFALIWIWLRESYKPNICACLRNVKLFHFKEFSVRTWVMCSWLRLFTALAEHLSSIPKTHIQ